MEIINWNTKIKALLWFMILSPYCVCGFRFAKSSHKMQVRTKPSLVGTIQMKDLSIDLSTGNLTITAPNVVRLQGTIKNLVQAKESGLKSYSNSANKVSVSYENGYSIQVTQQTTGNDGVFCYSVTEHSRQEEITDCFDYGGHHWYGAAETHDQLWPIEKWDIKKQEFVTRDPYNPGVFGSVQERYWLSSGGVAMFIPYSVPLFVSMNSTSNGNKICFYSRLKNSVYQNKTASPLSLTFDTCHADNITALHDYMASKYWSKPKDRPHLDVLVDPIWSTWAIYKKDINQSTVEEYAERILQYNLSISQLEIDDDWTPHYGDWSFITEKFPDPQSMITNLKAKIPAVTVWIHPFINTDSQSFLETADNGLLMNIYDADPIVPGLQKWWNPGYAGLLDFSNNQTRNWFLQKLSALKTDIGVDSFKFDAGEIEWMPKHSDMQIRYFHPSEYIKYYVDVAVQADNDQRRQEVRIGCRTQDAPILVRMLDRRSRWGFDNGLKTLIPTALTFGLLGYPFVLPDMIGGNAYEGVVVEAELYVRWLQVNVFLPSIQFSIPPWYFNDSKIVDYTRDMLNLRASYSPLFDKLSNESVKHGWPMVRPLWWKNPSDLNCLTISDQFMLGDDLLVAPVVEKGAVKRDIYLPSGRWLDGLSGSIVLDGGRFYYNYTATLYQLPYFVKQ